MHVKVLSQKSHLKFCLQRLTNWYIHSIHKCLKPFDCPYCDYKCVQKENIYVYNIHGHKEYWCIFPWIFTNSILALCPEETWMWIMWKIFSVWLAILIHFVQYYFFISRNVLFLPDFIISLYYARESVIAKITFEVSRIFCLQRLTNWYIHSIHKCLKPFDCPYCENICL